MAKQKISRREFLKGTAAAGLGLAATQLLGVAPAAFADAAYKPGKYQATAYGNLSYVTVECTFSEAQRRFGDDCIPLSEINRSVSDPMGPRRTLKVMDCVRWKFYPATRLSDGKTVWLPLDWFRLLSEFNGTSSGNTPEESLLQGLAELIERHACCIVDRERPVTPTIAPDSCKGPVLKVADVVGSTAVLLKHVVEHPEHEYIVATEAGILHEMHRQCPQTVLYAVPPEVSEGSVGCHCNECQYMKMNTLLKIYNCLKYEWPSVDVDPAIAREAVKPIERMLELS